MTSLDLSYSAAAGRGRLPAPGGPGVSARLIVSLLWVVLAGCSDRVGIEEPVVAGLDAEEPELVEFIQDLLESVRSDPDSVLMRGRLGMAYDVNSFDMAAQFTYAQVEALDPEDFRWPYYRATALAKLGRYRDALQSLDRAIAIDSDYPSAWLLRGAWLLDLDRHEDAAQAYRRATDLASDDATAAAATVGVARTLMRQDRTDEAVILLERLAASFKHPHVLQLLGNAYRRLGRLEEARSMVQSNTATPLGWPDERQLRKSEYVRGFSGRMLIAKNLLEQSQPRDALKILEPLRRTAPRDRNLLNNLSIAYKLAGRSAEAFEVLKLGLEADPDFHLFHFNIAVHYEDLGDDRRALQHLERAIQLDPALLAAQQRRVDLLIRAQRFDDALAALDEQARYAEAAPAALFDTGMVAGALEKWPLAIASFQQALSLDPSLQRGHLFLGRSLAEDGRFDEAREALALADKLGASAKDVAAARLRLDGLERGRQ